MTAEKLFDVSYHIFDGYAYDTSWCDDCPGRGNGCCKDDSDEEGWWYTSDQFLELAPSEEIVRARIKGRRVPDQDINAVKIYEVPWRMWQCWDRLMIWDGDLLEEGKRTGLPILEGREYVLREWLKRLVERNAIGF